MSTSGRIQGMLRKKCVSDRELELAEAFQIQNVSHVTSKSWKKSLLHLYLKIGIPKMQIFWFSFENISYQTPRTANSFHWNTSRDRQIIFFVFVLCLTWNLAKKQFWYQMYLRQQNCSSLTEKIFSIQNWSYQAQNHNFWVVSSLMSNSLMQHFKFSSRSQSDLSTVWVSVGSLTHSSQQFSLSF